MLPTISNNKVKRIHFIKSNNLFPKKINFQIKTAKKLADQEKLKKLFLEETKATNENDLTTISSALGWANSLWEHDGMTPAPKNASGYQLIMNARNKGAKYRCVEFGIILRDLLLSLGFVSRTVGLYSTRIDYFGFGHVVTEVWLDSYNKWMLLDPTTGTYVLDKNKKTPLNVYEIYKAKTSDEDVHIVLSKEIIKMKEMSKEDAIDYKEKALQFLHAHLGGMNISFKSGQKYESLDFLLLRKDPFYTFQGIIDERLFTDNIFEFYYPINRVAFKVKPIKERKSTQDTFYDRVSKNKLAIKTPEDVINNMHLIADKPEFKVELIHNMPNFSYFKVKINNKSERKVTSNSFNWKIADGINTLDIYGVNSFGKKGPVTTVKLSYK